MPALQDFIAKLKARGGTAHVLGLLSPGGVHSHQRQIAALAAILAEAGLPVAVHAFLDGRDTPPKSAIGYLRQFQADVARHGGVRIATVAGRYYAMDRDQRWDRVEKAYRALIAGQGEHAADPIAAVEAAYGRGESDEFVLPTALDDYRGMQDGDGVLFANFRADRIREIAGALVDPDFSGFARDQRVAFAAALGLVEYSEELNRFPRHAVSAARSERHLRRTDRRRRPEAAAHRRDREIRACDVFLQWRAGDRVSRRGAHPGAFAEGRDLRPAARDVGPRGDRQGGRGNRAPGVSMSSS